MIERKVVNEKLEEFLVQDFVVETLSRVGHSKTEVHKTPVGEKIIIHAARPGLIVGSKGSNIKKLTKVLKTKFKFDNPQIEIVEVKDADVNPTLIAENIAYQLERFGSQRFKGIAYSSMDKAIKGGAKGIEIVVSGKVPSSRARTWRFSLQYLKKSGDVALTGVLVSYVQAKLKTGVIGIQVRVMPGNIILPDSVELLPTPVAEVVEETAEGKVADNSESLVSEAKKEAKQVDAALVKGVNENSDKKSVPKKKRTVKKSTKKTSKKSTKKSTEDSK